MANKNSDQFFPLRTSSGLNEKIIKNNHYRSQPSKQRLTRTERLIRSPSTTFVFNEPNEYLDRYSQYNKPPFLNATNHHVPSLIEQQPKFQNDFLNPYSVSAEMHPKKSLRRSKTFKRIDMLSKPKCPPVKMSKADEHNNAEKDKDAEVESKPIRYREVTPRLLQLAEPKEWPCSQSRFSTDSKNHSSFDSKNQFFPKSMSLKSLKRIEELAKPKKSVELVKKNPFGVNPKALRATCPARIEELAKPKHYHDNFIKMLEGYVSKVNLDS